MRFMSHLGLRQKLDAVQGRTLGRGQRFESQIKKSRPALVYSYEDRGLAGDIKALQALKQRPKDKVIIVLLLLYLHNTLRPISVVPK